MEYQVTYKRKIKWGRVLIAILILMLLIGGSIMLLSKNNKKEEKNTPNKVEEKENKEEEQIDEVTVTLNKTPSTHTDFLNLSDGEYQTENGYTLTIKDGIATVDGHVIVNKTYSIPESYQPTDPEKPIQGEKCNECLDKEVLQAFRLMQSDASSIGLNIYISSGYRSYNYQDRLYNNYSATSGKEIADTFSARPGHSEHQTGLCFDLNEIDDIFADTDEGKWVNNNAHLYGFIIRYPKGKESITGYQYESWHLRYVGKELASKLYQDGEWLTIEEYYGISSNYGA